MKEFLASSESLNTNLTQIKISQRGKGLQINLVSNKQIRVFCQTLRGKIDDHLRFFQILFRYEYF